MNQSSKITVAVLHKTAKSCMDSDGRSEQASLETRGYDCQKLATCEVCHCVDGGGGCPLKEGSELKEACRFFCRSVMVDGGVGKEAPLVTLLLGLSMSMPRLPGAYSVVGLVVAEEWGEGAKSRVEGLAWPSVEEGAEDEIEIGAAFCSSKRQRSIAEESSL